MGKPEFVACFCDKRHSDGSYDVHYWGLGIGGTDEDRVWPRLVQSVRAVLAVGVKVEVAGALARIVADSGNDMFVVQ